MGEATVGAQPCFKVNFLAVNRWETQVAMRKYRKHSDVIRPVLWVLLFRKAPVGDLCRPFAISLMPPSAPPNR
jgi:hypothetical protein